MMDRDTFSHIRLWCPRPFGTYSQNKGRSPASVSGVGAGAASSSLCSRQADRASEDGGMVPEENGPDVGVENTPPEHELTPSSVPHSQASQPPAGPQSQPSSAGTHMEDGRVLLDTWYLIKPGNTKEKIAFFVAHQFSGAGQARSSAMKVKGNWATDCSKAKRRRRCSSYDPPPRSQSQDPAALPAPSTQSPDEPPTSLSGAQKTDLLSVAEMVALVEQRTAMALQGIVGMHSNHQDHGEHPQATSHQLLRGTLSDPTPIVFVPDRPSKDTQDSSAFQTDQELEQHESCRVAEAIAHFESQNLENRLHLGPGIDPSSPKEKDESARGAYSGIVTPPPPPRHSHGEVRIAFRVSNIDPRSQLEPAGRSPCMFMTCGGGSSQSGTRSKEKITCDLYQLVSPSPRDPSSLLLAATTASPKQDGDLSTDMNSAGSLEQEFIAGEKKGRERVSGFHVEVVVTGAVDQCVFYGKDSTENVQEETVCFAMPAAPSAGSDPLDDPPPGQLFFFQRSPEEELKGANACTNMSSKVKNCANNNNSSHVVGGNGNNVRPESPIVTEECSDPSLCRLYRHVSHDFLEIRFQIQRLLEPRQYMLLLPDHIMVNIFGYLPTRSLAALKCTCHYFKALIETFGVRAVDSRWNQDPLYRDDPCKQCKRQYKRGDVSLCRWHPKPYHHDLPYGRSYWMCCRRTDKDTPGCRVGLHDNNWVQHPADGSQPIRSKREDRREEAR